MGRIPDRWLDYTKCGNVIDGVPIVAFKTPLCDKFHRPNERAQGIFVEKDDEFTPAQLVGLLSENDNELSVVIDLTFTYRYYKGVDEFENEHGVQYEKVKCEGQKVPSDAVMNQVAAIFNNIIFENASNNTKKVAGIHCTHGLNRTGYLVARYLIEWLNYEPEIAIAAFNKSRGHSMERENYIEDLMTRNPASHYEEWKKNGTEVDKYSQRKIEVKENHEAWKLFQIQDFTTDDYSNFNANHNNYNKNDNRNYNSNNRNNQYRNRDWHNGYGKEKYEKYEPRDRDSDDYHYNNVEVEDYQERERYNYQNNHYRTNNRFYGNYRNQRSNSYGNHPNEGYGDHPDNSYRNQYYDNKDRHNNRTRRSQNDNFSSDGNYTYFNDKR